MDIFDEKLPAIELVRNAVNSKIGKFTKSDIEELVPSIKKTSVGNSLKILVEEGFIQGHGQGKNTFYTRK
ncbi:MAG: hypothetical protein ACOYJX_09195 [Acutalibacteraceae bacterium]